MKTRVNAVNAADEAGTEAMRYFLALKSFVEEFDLQGVVCALLPQLHGQSMPGIFPSCRRGYRLWL